MASPVNMGGLFATVNLDTGQALKEIKQLERAFRRALNPQGTGGGVRPGSLGSLGRNVRQTKTELDKASRSARRLGNNMTRAGKQAGRTAEQSRRIGEGLTEGLSTTLASFGAARSGNVFYALSSALRGVQRAGIGAGAGLTGAAVATAGIVTAAIAGVAAVGAFTFTVGKLASQTIKSAQTLETLLVSFEALLGSAERAQREFDFIVEAAEISPFFTDAIVKVDRFILAQGILNDELRQKTIKSLIDFGSAAGLTGDRLLDLGYALGQVYQAGRLTGDEARQLRNNFLGAELVLRELPQYAELTGLELKKAMESGEVSSRDFFEAFFAYTADFEDAALKQQQTLRGLRDTLVDVFQLGLGAAAIELQELDDAASPLEALKAPLRELLDIVDDIDFRPLVAAIGGLFDTITSTITTWLSTGGARGLVRFLTEDLPAAITFAVNVFRVFWAGVSVVFSALSSIFKAGYRAFTAFVQGTGASANTLTGVMKFVAGVFATGFSGLATVVGAATAAVIGSLGGMISVLIIASGVVRGFFALLSGESFSAGWADAHVSAAEALRGTWEAASGAAEGAAGAIVNAWENVLGLEALEIPEFEDPFEDISPAGGPDPFAGIGEGAEDASGGASKVAQEIAKAQNTLFELNQSWFDTRSDLEAGLLGPEGFEATVNQIVNMGKRILEAALTIGDPGLIAAIDGGVRQLIGLARQREEAADALKSAEKALEDAISERDKFVAKVRENTLDFANAFKTESETVREFQLVSDRGFFFETEEERQKSFLETLRERVAAAKEFFANVQRLRDLGLDEGLLEEIVLAGPETAGEVAAGLAEGGDAMVAEVNELQRSATRVADDLSKFAGQEFYQVGVDMAEAEVEGLESELQAITDAAIEIADTIVKAIAPFAVEMEETGKAGGKGIADGLNDSLTDIDTSLGNVSAAFGDGFTEINTNFGTMVSDGKILMDAAVRNIEDGFRRIGAAISREVESWQTFIDKAGGIGWDIVANLLDFLISFGLGGKILKWYRDVLSPRFSVLFDSITREWENGFLGAVSSVLALLYNLNPITWFLPFNVDASRVHRILVDAINWVIRQYNKIPFLPDLSLLQYNGTGGIFESSANVQFDPGSFGLSPSGTPVVVDATVYVGNEELDSHIETVVDAGSGQTDAYIYSGSGPF